MGLGLAAPAVVVGLLAVELEAVVVDEDAAGPAGGVVVELDGGVGDVELMMNSDCS